MSRRSTFSSSIIAVKLDGISDFLLDDDGCWDGDDEVLDAWIEAHNRDNASGIECSSLVVRRARCSTYVRTIHSLIDRETKALRLGTYSLVL